MEVFPISSNFEGDFVKQLVPVAAEGTRDHVIEEFAADVLRDSPIRLCG